VIAGGVAHGSQGSQGAHGLHGGHAFPYTGAHCSAGAPRHSQLQQRHPTALPVSVNNTVRISAFFMIRVSSRSIFVGL
jgi:hypothetical protein